MAPLRHPAPSLKQTNDQNDQGHHQQDVNDPAKRGGRDHSEEPHDREDESDSPKHGNLPFTDIAASVAQ